MSKNKFTRPTSPALAAIQEAQETQKVSEKTARMSLDLPVSLHKRLKLLAVKEGCSMSDLIRNWIEERVKEMEGK